MNGHREVVRREKQNETLLLFVSTSRQARQMGGEQCQQAEVNGWGGERNTSIHHWFYSHHRRGKNNTAGQQKDSTTAHIKGQGQAPRISTGARKMDKLGCF